MNLNGRVSKLEGIAKQHRMVSQSSTCRTCGLPHVRLPVPLALVEAVVRYGLGASQDAPPRLCLCRLCCSEQAAIARLTHSKPARGSA